MDTVLLAIETAGSGCSVAVARGESLLAAENRALRHGHAEVLLPMIERVVAAAALPRSALDIIAAAIGPGGFTGIRVGLGAARGIALALKARLVGVTGFAAVAAALAGKSFDGAPMGGGLLVALDSRRDDFYVQLFDRPGLLPLAEPTAVPPGALADYVAARMPSAADGLPLLIAGDAAEAAAAALGRRFKVETVPDSAPDALGVLAAARRQQQRDSACREVRPFYLRPPDVTLPKQRQSLRAVAK